jgi:hypothetical protein
VPSTTTGQLGKRRQRRRELVQHIVQGDDADQATDGVDDGHSPNTFDSQATNHFGVAGIFLDGRQWLEHQVAQLDQFRIKPCGDHLYHDVAVSKRPSLADAWRSWFRSAFCLDSRGMALVVIDPGQAAYNGRPLF